MKIIERNLTQAQFNVRRDLSGGVRITCPPEFVVPPLMAVEIAQAILKMAGVETITADPGQTVIRPPRPKLGPSFPRVGTGGL